MSFDPRKVRNRLKCPKNAATFFQRSSGTTAAFFDDATLDHVHDLVEGFSVDVGDFCVVGGTANRY